MKIVIEYVIKHHIIATILILMAMLFGSFSLLKMNSSFFPPINPKKISIRVIYPGASPQEIEEGVVLKIENNLKGIPGVEKSTSISQENSATITIETQKNSDGEIVLQDVKNAVQQINSFPTGMEPPVIYQLPIENFAISFAISGEITLDYLKQTAKLIERELLAIDGISQLSIEGFPEEEIQIYVDPNLLRFHQLTLSDVANAISKININQTAGEIRTQREEMKIRLSNRFYDPESFERIIIKSDSFKPVRLSDIATVKKDWVEKSEQLFLNEKLSVIITIKSLDGEDILYITDKVKQYLSGLTDRFPQLTATVIRDRSVILNQRIQLLTKNGITGFLLVLLVLTLFLNIRLSFWVASAIPICFLGLFIIGKQIGMTINVISLFGMIVVIGILVDDGIVIGENIFQKAEQGMDPSTAAIKGTLEVMPSVFYAIITTIVAFMPFFFLDGFLAEVMSNMSLVVIITLLIALVEGFFILPAHLAHSKALLSVNKRSFSFQYWFVNMLNFLRDRVYAPILRHIIDNPLISLTGIIVILMITIGATKGGLIKGTFFPFVDSDNITINLKMPAGTPREITIDRMNIIYDGVQQANQTLSQDRDDGNEVIESVLVKQNAVSHTGSIRIGLLDGETRNLESFKVIQAIRKSVEIIHDAESVEYGTRGFFGRPVSISLLGNNLSELNQAKQQLKAKLSEINALKDIIDNDEKGSKEIFLKLTRIGKALGFTEGDVLRQVRSAFFGSESLRLQDGVDEVKVWVRAKETHRDSISHLDRLRLRARNGQFYPLSQIASYSIQRKTTVINHLNGLREIKVEANLSDDKLPLPPIINMITAEILPPILAQFPDVSYAFGGQKEETQKTQKSAFVVMPMMLITMFMLLTLCFKSFSQSATVMLLIPFAYIGMAWGHFIHNKSINLLSIFGFIALIGILVNDAVVFVNRFNLLRQDRPVLEALYDTGISRFRAIVLTSLTTIAGLSPLILEKSRQAQFLVPMAISVSYGLLFATILILIILPAYLSIIRYVSVFLSTKWNKLAGKMVHDGYK